MNYKEACEILELPSMFNEKELKHNYYLKALQYHPDKNPDVNATNKFQEVLDAYTFLNNYLDINGQYNDEINENSYINILEKFTNGILNKNIDVKQFLSILNNKYSEITIELLNHFSKDTLLKIHKFIGQYSDILYINKQIAERIEELINDYTKNDIIHNLNPTLENLLNDDIYILQIETDTYYIPMWHHELIYEISNNLLIVNCEPNIPDYITIDQYNNLYVNVSTTIQSVLNNNLYIYIGDKTFEIPKTELYIRRYQRYIFKRHGISLIDTNDVYNVNSRADIYINIYFTDIV